MSTARPTTEFARSARARPRATEALAIGRDRKRSVMPRFESSAIAVIVDSRPNSIASANMPGSRKAM